MLAILYCGVGNRSAAITVCENAIKYDADNYELYFNAAIAYMEIKDYENAKKYFTMAILRNSDLAEAYFGLGQIAVIKEEYSVAEENYLNDVRPNNPDHIRKFIYKNVKKYLQCP